MEVPHLCAGGGRGLLNFHVNVYHHIGCGRDFQVRRTCFDGIG